MYFVVEWLNEVDAECFGFAVAAAEDADDANEVVAVDLEYLDLTIDSSRANSNSILAKYFDDVRRPHSTAPKNIDLVEMHLSKQITKLTYLLLNAFRGIFKEMVQRQWQRACRQLR